MVLVQEVDSLQDAIKMILLNLLDGSAETVQPRGLPTREIIGAAVKITNPRNRLVLRPKTKKWSLAFAMAEYLWYMRGENSVDTMAFYAPVMRSFSDDDRTLNSAYGYRIFGAHESIGFNQWDAAKSRLRKDPDTRQAVIHIRTPRDSLLNTKDHPCTIALQFLQRSGKLHLVVTMRSNDIILGTSYDIFSFTMMQEQMALELGLDLGNYFHQVGSWHLYSHQTQLADQMIKMGITPNAMPPVEAGLSEIIADEERIRGGQAVDTGSGYWRDWRLVLSAFAGLSGEKPQLNRGYRDAWELGQQRRIVKPSQA